MLTNTGTWAFLGTYGSPGVYRGNSYIGLNSGSQGSALVSGSGSSWSTGRLLYLGYGGEGTLQIENAGSVSSEDVLISYQVGSQGAITVSGAGSQLIASKMIEVAYHGNGSLRIEDGGWFPVREG